MDFERERFARRRFEGEKREKSLIETKKEYKQVVNDHVNPVQ